MGKHGSGSVKQNRTGRWQGLLPRSLSKPPSSCAHPDGYQQPVLPTFESKGEARDHLDRCILLVTKGTPLGEDGEMTVRLLFASYLESQHRRLLPKYGTRTKVAYQLRGHLSFANTHAKEAHFWEMPYYLVKPEDVRSYIRKLEGELTNKKDEPLSSSYVRGVIGKLKGAFEHGDLFPNPCYGQKLPAKKRVEISYLTIGDQKEVLQSEAVPIRHRVMIGCLASSGLRIGEFLSIKYRDVVLDVPSPHLMLRTGGLDVPLKGMGPGGTRRVELVEPALSFWKLWMTRFFEKKESQRVFTGERDGYLKHWADDLRAIGDSVGIRLFPHLMRHTYAMCTINNWWGGPDLEVRILPFVQHQLGHQSPDVTLRHYGKQISAAREAAALRGERLPELPPTTAFELLGEDEEIMAKTGGPSLVPHLAVVS